MNLLDKELKDLNQELEGLTDRDRLNLINKNKDKLFSEEFYKKLKESEPADVIDFILILPAEIFGEVLDQFGDVIAEKIDKADIKTIAKIFDKLPKDLRKEFNSRFMKNLMEYSRRLSIRDIVSMIHNVSAPSRPGLLSPMRSFIFSKDFDNKILESDLSELEEFISVLPDDIRKQFFSKHKELLLSDAFGKKLKEADKEEITNLVLRWFPQDLYRAFVEQHKNILSEKGLKFPL